MTSVAPDFIVAGPMVYRLFMATVAGNRAYDEAIAAGKNWRRAKREANKARSQARKMARHG